MNRIKYFFAVALAFVPNLLLADGQAPIGAYPAKIGAATITSLTASNALLGSVIVTNGLTVTNALTVGTGDFTVSSGVTRIGQLVATSPANGYVPIQAYTFSPQAPNGTLAGAIFQFYSGNVNHALGLEGGGVWLSSDGQNNIYYANGATVSKKFSFETANGAFRVNGSGNTLQTIVDTNAFVYARVGSVVTSAATITPTGPVFHVSGTTTINTINLPATGFTGSITIIPDGAFATGTSGNIAIASTAVVSKALRMTYDGTKWYPDY